MAAPLPWKATVVIPIGKVASFNLALPPGVAVNPPKAFNLSGGLRHETWDSQSIGLEEFVWVLEPGFSAFGGFLGIRSDAAIKVHEGIQLGMPCLDLCELC